MVRAAEEHLHSENVHNKLYRNGAQIECTAGVASNESKRGGLRQAVTCIAGRRGTQRRRFDLDQAHDELLRHGKLLCSVGRVLHFLADATLLVKGTAIPNDLLAQQTWRQADAEIERQLTADA